MGKSLELALHKREYPYGLYALKRLFNFINY